MRTFLFAGLVLLIVFVGILGVSLRTLQKYRPFEGFTTYQNRSQDGLQTGYVTSPTGGDVFRPNSDIHHPQIKNVPSSDEYVMGKIKRYETNVPLKISGVDYKIGGMNDAILGKFTRGTDPEIILNPDSERVNQETCILGNDCDEYVYNSHLYCPVGMERLQTQTPGKHTTERKYQGCYLLGRDYPAFACRHDDPLNSCNILKQKRIQRVGRGFLVFPPKRIFMKAEQEGVSVNELWERKQHFIRIMLRSYELQKTHPTINSWSEASPDIDNSVIENYANTILEKGYVMVQQKNTQTPMRIGFLVPDKSVPNIATPLRRTSYDLSRIKYIHDTTKDLPVVMT